jgi:hypothetical protein
MTPPASVTAAAILPNAQGTLEQGAGDLDELGARLWAQKTRAEMARITGRRAARDELAATRHGSRSSRATE